MDSNYLVDYLRGRTYTKELLEKIKIKEYEAYLSVVTLFELYVGALLSANKESKFEDIEKLLNWFFVVSINKDVMFIAAKIHVDLRKRGLMVEIQDVLIAASAISLNMPLLTNNKKHFQNIGGLKFE